MDKNNKILLTIDLEEFDLPSEYGLNLPFDEQIAISNKGMEKLNFLLDKYEIKATFFITSTYAQINPSLVRQISKKHEVASHSHTHTGFTKEDIAKSKQILEEISQVRVNGFRMPRFDSVEHKELIYSGYTYDSSLNPTWIPGRYNNFFKPRNKFIEPITGMTILPVSVSPIIRFPLFWLSFKNIPFSFYYFLCKQTLSNDGYLHLYFHSWEFADINSINIPSYIRKLSGDTLISKFEKLLVKLKRKGNFITISEYLNQNS